MPAKKKVVKKKAAVKNPAVSVLKMPKTPGALADALYKQNQVISAINAQLTAEKQKLQKMEDHAFEVFQNQDLEGAKGKAGQVSITRNVVPQVEDPSAWEKVFKYIIKTKDFSVLQKRLGTTHVKDLWNDGKKIPGIVPYTKVGLSVRKITAKK